MDVERARSGRKQDGARAGKFPSHLSQQKRRQDAKRVQGKAPGAPWKSTNVRWPAGRMATPRSHLVRFGAGRRKASLYRECGNPGKYLYRERSYQPSCCVLATPKATSLGHPQRRLAQRVTIRPAPARSNDLQFASFHRLQLGADHLLRPKGLLSGPGDDGRRRCRSA